jgi:hypothetical protein
VQYIYEIAKIKKEIDPDLKKVELPQVMQMVIAQLSSCGLVLSENTQKPPLIAMKSKV